MTRQLGLFEMLKGVFSGPMKGWSIYVLILGLGITGFWFYAIFQFLGTEDLIMSIRWGVGVVVASIFLGMMKIWFWLMMWKTALVAELK